MLVAAALIGTLAAMDFVKMMKPDDIFPSAALTEMKMLSDYSPGLKGTGGDTRVYVFDGDEPGATVLLLGGTHPNEPAAFVAATVITENIFVHSGRIIVIPQACASGFTCTDPFEGYPQSYTIETNSGSRHFRFGSRVCSPLDSWPDPLVYTHYPSGQRLSGFESRNLNRSYPGRSDGSFAERVGFGIMELIRQEEVDIAFDLHEAAPEIPIINALVYHEKGEEIGLTAVLDLEMLDMSYAPELSPSSFRGLSHREWGDRTDVIPFLMETSNPIQGRLRGKTNADLIVKGISPRYLEAQESGALRIVYEPTGEPIKRRVGRHIQGFIALLEAYNLVVDENPIEVDSLPSYHDIMDGGLGSYLN